MVSMVSFKAFRKTETSGLRKHGAFVRIIFNFVTYNGHPDAAQSLETAKLVALANSPMHQLAF